MEISRNLADCSITEQVSFINSFDIVLADIDGVIWTNYTPIDGAAECVNALKKIGKTVKYITNNTMHNPEHICEQFEKIGIKADCCDVSTPLIATIQYLKNIKFDKTIYVFGTETFKSQLRKAGFKVADNVPHPVEESLSILVSLIEDDESIGAVIYDVDINVTFLKLQRALTYLKRKDCLFIVGGADRSMALGNAGPIIGLGHFQDLLRELSGREFIRLAKPSAKYAEFINKEFNITDPKRVLFIGDSIPTDLGFAAVAGYKKLLTLTGNSTPKDLLNWSHPKGYIPEYYVDSLGTWNEIIENLPRNLK